jgi:hypothetical protein
MPCPLNKYNVTNIGALTAVFHTHLSSRQAYISEY